MTTNCSWVVLVRTLREYATRTPRARTEQDQRRPCGAALSLHLYLPNNIAILLPIISILACLTVAVAVFLLLHLLLEPTSGFHHPPSSAAVAVVAVAFLLALPLLLSSLPPSIRYTLTGPITVTCTCN